MIYSARPQAVPSKPGPLTRAAPTPGPLKSAHLKSESWERPAQLANPPSPSSATGSPPLGSPKLGSSAGRQLPIAIAPKTESPDLDAPLLRSQLEDQILKRIEKRLPSRIHNLSVTASTNAMILGGQCNTFYTKQLAQHVAMCILEYEQLINNIDVRTLK